MTDHVPMTRGDVKIIRKRTVKLGYYRAHRFSLRHRLFGGGWSDPLTRVVLDARHGVALLPYDPARDAVVLIEQFRIGALAAGDTDPWLLEIVGGAVEDGETTADVARREALEEAGCAIDEIVPMMEVYTTPGGSSERIALFCGRVDCAGIGGIHGLAEEGEDIRVFVEPLDSALARIAGGGISNLIAIAALQWLALHRDELRQRWLKLPPGA